MRNIKLIITYDGTNYCGFQKNDLHTTIESTLQPIIEKLVQHKAPLQAASRTDAGVHANGQVVNFFTSLTSFDPDRFLFSLNRLLPQDIAVLSVEEMDFSFHPTIDCLGKEYHYYVCFGAKQLPIHRLYSWHVPYAVDIQLIEKAIPLLTGRRDFRAFCNVKKNRNYVNCVRNIQMLSMKQIDKNRIVFSIRGNHFLYKMVRNLVGTLIDVGKGKLKIEELSAILNSKSRPQAGVCAPAHGLFLHQLFYPSNSH